jgi:hypothetical protein
VATGCGLCQHLRVSAVAQTRESPVHSLLQGLVPCMTCCGRRWWMVAVVRGLYWPALCSGLAAHMCVLTHVTHHCSCCVCRLQVPGALISNSSSRVHQSCPALKAYYYYDGFACAHAVVCAQLRSKLGSSRLCASCCAVSILSTWHAAASGGVPCAVASPQCGIALYSCVAGSRAKPCTAMFLVLHCR